MRIGSIQATPGMEPTINWELPEGFSVGEFAFPTPHLLPFGDLVTYGYEEPILLLAELTVPDGLDARGTVFRSAARRAGLSATTRSACRSDPTFRITLVVGDGSSNDAAAEERFAEARGKLPGGR